jgi:hypothetical protein
MTRRFYDPPSDRLIYSTYFWLSVLRSSRLSQDYLLEQVARRRLTDLGARVVFDSEQTPNQGGHGDA